MSEVHNTLRNPGHTLAEHSQMMRKMAGMSEVEYIDEPEVKTAAAQLTDEQFAEKIASDADFAPLIQAGRHYGHLLGLYQGAERSGDPERIKTAEADLAQFLDAALTAPADIEKRAAELGLERADDEAAEESPAEMAEDAEEEIEAAEAEDSKPEKSKGKEEKSEKAEAKGEEKEEKGEEKKAALISKFLTTLAR